MSVPRPGSMRGSQVERPLLLLLFLLLLHAGTVLCQDDVHDEEEGVSTADEDLSAGDTQDDTLTSDVPPDDPETTPAMEPPPIDEDIAVEDISVDGAEVGSGVTDQPEDEDDPSITGTDESLSPTIILIPVGLVVLIIAMIVGGIFICRRCNAKARKRGLKEEDPYLDGSPSEKVPMPMFEEDVPSVLELEMEELDQLMQQGGEATTEPMQT